MVLIPILILAAFICVVNIGTESAKAGTVIPGGSITSDTTWKWEDSPYYVENAITVVNGVTLTIEPGVTVKSRKTTPPELCVHFYIEGNLVAVGTPSQMINFTSNASLPASKDWGNIWINSTGNAVIDYCNVTYGNLGVYLFYASNVNVTNSTFTNNEIGIKLKYATNDNIRRNMFSQNRIGNIKLENSENNTFTKNNITLSDQYGLYSQNSVNNKIYHNNFVDNLILQAGDDLNGNFWNDSYPSGGNYWSDWSPITPDLYDGAITPQTTGSSDGICDNPYYIDADSVDYYPLKYPFGSPPPDNESPMISDVNATPDPQEVYDFVNISAVVADNEQVGGVWINITDPNSATPWNFSMSYNIIDDRFYFNASYSLLGTYQFTIFTNDTSCNWNFSSGSFTIEDSTPPLIDNVASDPDTQDVFGSVNVSAVVTDNYNLFDVWVNISLPDGSSTNTTMNQTLGNVFYLNRTYDRLGVYNYIVWTNDTSNNWNLSLGSFTIKDSTPPSINNVASNPDVQEAFGNVNISATVTDNYDLYSVWVNITKPDGSSINITMNETLANIFYMNQSYDQFGVYNFIIWANDTSDNWNFSSGSFMIGDFADPLINNVLSNPLVQEVFGNVNISATVTDNLFLYGVWVNITRPNGSSINITMNETLGNVFYLNQSYDELGVYDFTIWANDTSGNWNFSSSFFEIRDSTPPSIDAVVTNPSTQEVFGNLNISARVVDNFDLYGVWINISKPDGSSINTTMNEALVNVFYFNRSYNQVGVYDFIIWANDTSCNWNFSSGSFTIEDSTPPLIDNVASNPYIQEVFGYVNISATISDNYDFYDVWVNISLPNGSWTNITMNEALGNVFYLNQTYDQVGVYDFIIWANDTSNNWNFSSGNFTIGDFTPPSVSNIISNPETQEIFKNVNISAIVTDNFKLSSIWVNITKPDHSSINITMNEAPSNTFYLNQSYDQLGLYNFTIWANDTSNNWNSAPGFFSIKDLGIPQATAEVSPPYWKNVLTFEVVWTASDDLGLSNITLLYRYSADNLFWSPWVEYSYNNTASGTSTSGSFQFIAPAEGYYEFFANASDIGNNWEPDALIAEAVAAVDVASPSSNINPISLYWVNSPSLTFYASATDALSGVKDVTLLYRYSTDNVSWGLWEIFEIDEIEPWSWVFDFPKGEGYYEFYCIGKDNANNVESKSIGEVICAHDITPPTAYAGGDQVVGPSTTINFDGTGSSDNFGVIDNYTWTITKDSTVIAILYGSNPMFNFDDVGDYTVTLTVKDPSGNADDDAMIVEVVVEFVDSEAPTITHSVVPATQEVYGIVNITAVVTDNVGVFDVWVQIFDPENSELENVSMNRIGLTDNYWHESAYSIVGIYNYTVWANDTSNNWALANGSFVIQDSTPPIANAGEDKGINLSDTFHFDGLGSTDNVGIINYTWNITKNGNSIITFYGMNPSYRFGETGSYEVTLTVRDAAGNTDSDTVTVTVSSKVQEGPNYWWLILLIIILIIVVILFFLLARRKKKEPEELTPETSVQPDQTPVSPPPILQEEEAKEHDS